MNFYLQTADPARYSEMSQCMTFAGIITTPEMFYRENRDVRKTIDELLELLTDDQKLFVPVIQSGFRAILKEARQLKAIKANVVPVIPYSMDGLMALKACSTLKVEAACSHVSSAPQAMIALNNNAPILISSAAEAEKSSDYDRESAMLMQTLQHEKIRRSNTEETPAITELIASDFSSAWQIKKAMADGADSVALTYEQCAGLLNIPAVKEELQNDRDQWIFNYTRMELLD